MSPAPRPSSATAGGCAPNRHLTATVTLPGTWDPRRLGATLDLGQVVDAVVVTVNSRPVPVTQLTAGADPGHLSRPGVNTIEVKVG